MEELVWRGSGLMQRLTQSSSKEPSSCPSQSWGWLSASSSPEGFASEVSAAVRTVPSHMLMPQLAPRTVPGMTEASAGMSQGRVDDAQHRSSKGAECPQKIGMARTCCRGESGCKDVSPAEPLLLITSTTQSLAVQPRNPSNGSIILQCPPNQASASRQKGHYVGKCGKNQMEILLRK
ncbi:uncharacterized protein LOC109370567 [Meleagris gallopavo]|uniref:uncharacterized protein LOC109370567 n=1 Tax=Meleagris gallopavo TaxID=9103 RepID=UPI000939C125|nr:uncharacterized protein LOC109370567 [Meleagris gallopavo]